MIVWPQVNAVDVKALIEFIRVFKLHSWLTIHFLKLLGVNKSSVQIFTKIWKLHFDAPRQDVNYGSSMVVHRHAWKQIFNEILSCSLVALTLAFIYRIPMRLLSELILVLV